jgi:hypothetical protein
MLLDGNETAKVQEAFMNIKKSMDDLVKESCTPGRHDLTCVKDADKQYFRAKFREALREKEAFNGLDDAGKLKYYGWAWHPATWDMVMKILLEGYARLDRIIRQDEHLDDGVVEELEMFIGKYKTCVAHMHEYKRIWTEEIVPRQEEQSKAWKASRLKPAKFNPYGVGVKPLHVMLDALQRLGHPMDGYQRTPHTDQPEILRYEDDRPGLYTGYTEANNIARGVRFGQARMKYDNGDEYDGHWDRDHFHGQGTFSKKNRIGVGYVWQFEGIFSQDEPVSGTLREWQGGGGTIETQSDVWVEASVFDLKPAKPKKDTIRPLHGTTYYP